MFLVVFACIAGILIFWLVRIQWVYKKRIRLIKDDYFAYRLLKSYDYMLYHFWVWDIEEFIQREKD